MKTSVIIPCHNAGETLGIQLECLASQKGAAPFEVLVVDNKSTDRTREVAALWADKLNLRIIDAHKHQGVSYTRNRGIGEALGEKLIFIDGDDAIAPNYIGCCQRTLDEVAVYVSGFDPVEASEFVLGRDHLMGLIEHKLLPYRSPLPTEADPAWPILPGCSFGARRDLMIELGGFDVSYEPGAEDNELAFRLMEAGYELKVQRSTTIAYRVDSQQSRPFKVYYRRAKSAALLKTNKKVWASQGDNLFSLGFATLRASFVLLRAVTQSRGDYSQVKARLAQAVGTLHGYVEYQILGVLPQAQIARGLKE